MANLVSDQVEVDSLILSNAAVLYTHGRYDKSTGALGRKEFRQGSGAHAHLWGS